MILKTADKTIEACKNIIKIGKIENIRKISKNDEEVKENLKIAKGIGNTTINIFLRELPWAEHDISPYALISAEKHGLKKN